jgi:hypothetical protein
MQINTPSPVHRELLEKLTREAQADEDVIGLLLAGSLARGDAYPTSDVDFYFLLKDGCTRPFQADMWQGILVERSYMDFERARAKIEQNPMTIYTFLDGPILCDRDGSVRRLAEIAHNRLMTYVVSAEECSSLAHWLTSARVKVVAARDAGDELKAAYVVATTSWELLKRLWAVNQKPILSSGGVLPHLKELSRTPGVSDWPSRLFLGGTAQRIETFCLVSGWIVKQLEAGLVN